MQKQEKKQEIKKKYTQKKFVNKKSNNFKFYKSKKNKLKNLFRLKKVLKYKSYRRNFQRLLSKRRFNKFSRQLNIKVTANNIFCHLRNRHLNKTLATGTSGKYKINTSRKKLRYTTKLTLSSFFKNLNPKTFSKSSIIKITAPIKIRKQILLFLSEKMKKQNLIIKINEKKCFNGCRPPKKRRKKRKGLRIFK